MTGQPLRFAELVPGAEFYDVVRLRDEYRSARRVALELANHPQITRSADELWDPMWLPLLRLFGKGFVVINAQPRPISPVHIMWHDDDHDDRARVVWPSVASFVKFCIEQFHAGVYVVGSDGAVDGPTLTGPAVETPTCETPT